MQAVQSVSASTHAEIVRYPETPLVLNKNQVSHRKKNNIILIAKILPSGFFQTVVSISLYSA